MTDAERVAGEVRASHEAFKEQSDNLRATADETLTKVSEVMGSFSGSLEEFTAKSNAIVDSTSNFNGVIKSRSNCLTSVPSRPAANWRTLRSATAK